MYAEKLLRMGWISDEKVADSFQDIVLEISSFSRFKASSHQVKLILITSSFLFLLSAQLQVV